jgi:hypothetical protein
VGGQAADAGLHAGASDEEWRRRPLLFAPLIPAIFGVLAAVIPEWSAPWAIANACLLAGSVAFMTVIVFRGGYRSPKLRVAYTISQLDQLCTPCGSAPRIRTGSPRAAPGAAAPDRHVSHEHERRLERDAVAGVDQDPNPSGTPATIAGVSRAGRNERCPCGSGLKVKRCCGVERGPSLDELERAYLSGQALAAALHLAPLDDVQLEDLHHAIFELPACDLGLQVPLLPLATPEFARLCDAVADDDPDAGEGPLEAVLARVDTASLRARLVRRLLELRDAGSVDAEVTSTAVIDLASSSQDFLRGSLIEAVAVAVGAARTPGGLVVASG